MGEYVTQSNPNGIRRAAYTVPSATVHDSYADVGAGGFEVHSDGEVWAATLWDLRTQLGETITDRIVLNGMKFTPTRPSFLNARDGILQADQNLNGGVNRCAIWTVFARHGMGVSAVGNDGTTHTAATNVPSDCGGTCIVLHQPDQRFGRGGGRHGHGQRDGRRGLHLVGRQQRDIHHHHVGARRHGQRHGRLTPSPRTPATTSRTGTMTIAGQTFTVTQAGTGGGGGTELIVNPGFEAGTAPWVVSGQVTRSQGTFPHSGTDYIIVNGVNSRTGTLYQTVTIPSGARRI